MSELHLDSLEIKNFRCFEHLTIEKLGRVNLIVGKNSVGKTCLLEALLIYATQASFTVIHKILSDRQELNFREKSPVWLSSAATPYGYDFSSPAILLDLIKALRHIFFRHELIINKTTASISSNNNGVEFGAWAWNPRTNDRAQVDASSRSMLDRLLREAIHINWRIALSARSSEETAMSLFPKEQLDLIFLTKLQETHTLFIPHEGLANKEMENLWNRIALTEAESEVTRTIQYVNNDIERLGFVSDSQSMERYPIAKIKDRQEPLPLGLLGDGVTRALGIALALWNSSNGILLIDEFETGLHHSVQTDIWRMIFETARRLNVQVFATTHSLDCVEAFQEASAENESEAAMLISLQQRKAGVKAVLLDKNDLKMATRGRIEVR